jgi:hypothetical protein
MKEADLLTKPSLADIFSAVVEAILAQLVERVTCNLEVLGSIPGDGSGLLDSFDLMGRFPSGQRGQTVNLLAYAFEGSNPSLPIAPSPREGAFFRDSRARKREATHGLGGQI